MLPMQFPLRQPRLSWTSPPYLKKLPSSSSRVCTGMELSTCTYSCRTTTRKLPAIFHKIELGICLWSLHAVLSTIFSHVYIKMQGPSPCQKLKFKCVLCCCCCLIGSIKIILNPISSGTTK